MTTLKNRRLTARDIARMPEVNMKNASRWIICRALDEEGLKPRVAPRRPRMTSEHRKLRLEFCKAYKQFSVKEWRRVAFADEAKIC